MLKADVRVGATYLMNHTSGKIKVRILSVKTRKSWGRMNGPERNMTHWIALNLKTGREIEIKSAAKLISEVAA